MIQDELVQSLKRKAIKIVNSLEFYGKLTIHKRVICDKSHP